ncbi:mCG144893, partial [Mus musculus]
CGKDRCVLNLTWEQPEDTERKSCTNPTISGYKHLESHSRDKHRTARILVEVTPLSTSCAQKPYSPRPSLTIVNLLPSHLLLEGGGRPIRFSKERKLTGVNRLIGAKQAL